MHSSRLVKLNRSRFEGVIALVEPGLLVEAGALGVGHELPPECFLKEGHEFALVAPQKEEVLLMVRLVEIGAFEQDVENGPHARLFVFEEDR
jgi:transposase